LDRKMKSYEPEKLSKDVEAQLDRIVDEAKKRPR